MKKHTLLTLIAFHLAAFASNATILINFDTDAYGNPIDAPPLLIDTVHLSELYAPLGVHFFGPDGPNGHDGGAIVNQAGNVGVAAHSGANFLGFNRAGGILMDGGVAQDPETITFDTLVSNISIFAAGGHSIKTFLMQGFDDNGILIASDTVSTQGWAELELASPLGIKSVVLTVTIPDFEMSRAFVFDDLSVDFVPEPSTTSLLLCAVAIGLVLLFLRTKIHLNSIIQRIRSTALRQVNQPVSTCAVLASFVQFAREKKLELEHLPRTFPFGREETW